MGRDDRKIEIILLGNESSQLLKGLAAGLKHAVLPDALKGFASHIESCSKLQFTVKQHGGMAEIELKVKGLASVKDASGEKHRPESFKTLKKRLKTLFKLLQYSLASSMLPPPEVVEKFLQDSLAMCAHAGRGEHDYGRHLELCNALKTAFDQKDRRALGEVMKELETCKKACHSSFE